MMQTPKIKPLSKPSSMIESSGLKTSVDAFSVSNTMINSKSSKPPKPSSL